MSMISLSNLTFSYPGSYQPVFENCSVTFDTDWRLGLTGRNGRGKTTLLRLLLGSQKKEYGLCDYLGSIVSKTEFVYFPM
ncbi:MAG: ATP-binding cassette domain-containing protein, partial [Porphyromonadaceae bacterium]|nr:ATP-binding cassette domain-containing protein [Porphyromonadaceae bacterium]